MHGLETVLRKHKKNCQESSIWFSKTFGDKSPQSCSFQVRERYFLKENLNRALSLSPYLNPLTPKI